MSDETKPREYTVSITAIMPGQVKPTTYPVTVTATSLIEAQIQGIDEWRRATEPRDVRVKLTEVKSNE